MGWRLRINMPLLRLSGTVVMIICKYLVYITMLLYGRSSLQSSLWELRATVSTLSMIAVIVLLAALPLAGASLNCSFPGSTPEG